MYLGDHIFIWGNALNSCVSEQGNFDYSLAKEVPGADMELVVAAPHLLDILLFKLHFS